MNLENPSTERFSFELRFEQLQTEELAVWLANDMFSSGPVREDSLLPSWNAPNWVIEGARVRQLRSRAGERERRRVQIMAHNGSMDPFSLIQNPPVPTLAFGEWRWADYELHAGFSGGRDGPTGVAFRYQDARHYYALTIEDDVGLSLMLRSGDAHHILARVPLDASQSEYEIVIRANGSELQAGVVGGPVVRVVDATYAHGRCAFVAEGESTYGPVHAEGSKFRASNLAVPEAPEMTLLAEGTLDEAQRHSRVLFRDVDGDGLPELVTDDDHGTAVHCQHLIHGSMWDLGPYEHPLSQGGDLPLCAYDIDGDGKNELVFTADFGIHVHDAVSGDHRSTVDAPRAEPYRDNADYPHERLLGDAICPMRTELGKPLGFYVKDRYWNVWVYDHHLRPLWHRALNCGHFPLPIQLNAGEPDYLFASRTLLSPTGEPVWDLKFPDHSDAIGLFNLRDRPRLYVAAGEEGLLEIEPKTGELVTQLKWGHVQQYTLGRFLSGQPGHQLLATTQWREPGITFVVDDQLNLVHRWVEMSAEVGNRALPWGTSGTDLVVNRSGIRDPLTGTLIRPLPQECGQIRHLSVVDLPQYGNGCLLIVNESSWQIWGPGANVPVVPPRYRPNAFMPSGYLPILDF